MSTRKFRILIILEIQIFNADAIYISKSKQFKVKFQMTNITLLASFQHSNIDQFNFVDHFFFYDHIKMLLNKNFDDDDCDWFRISCCWTFFSEKIFFQFLDDRLNDFEITILNFLKRRKMSFEFELILFDWTWRCIRYRFSLKNKNNVWIIESMI